MFTVIRKFGALFLAVMITSKLILQIIAHNSAQYLSTIVDNYQQYIVQYSRSFSFAERLDIKGAHAQISFKKIPEKAEFFYAVDTHRL